MARGGLIGPTGIVCLLLLAPSAAAAAKPLKPAAAANRCVDVRTVGAPRGALRVFVKPTGLGRVMLSGPGARVLAPGEGSAVDLLDDPGPRAEWGLRSFGRRGTSAGSRRCPRRTRTTASRIRSARSTAA